MTLGELGIAGDDLSKHSRRKFGSEKVFLNKSVLDRSVFTDVVLRKESIEGRSVNRDDHTSGSPPTEESQDVLALKVEDRDTSGDDVWSVLLSYIFSQSTEWLA